MNGIPVLHAEGENIARAWENSVLELHKHGCRLATQYDRPDDSPSLDATMTLVVADPLAEPMIHRDFPCGFEELQEYVMEVCDGIKDHLIRDPDDPTDTRWEYTYHQRLFDYTVPGAGSVDQIERMIDQLVEAPHTRRAQAVTWKPWVDTAGDDPACMQSIWCRIHDTSAGGVLDMNVRFRSNDAYKAAFMNIFALIRLQQRIAERVSERLGRPITLGRYVHSADSYHIYGKDLAEFEGRFLGAIKTRTFEGRTIRYEDVADMMESARAGILKKAGEMGS